MKVNKHGLNDTIEEIKTMIKNLEQANDTISSIIIPSDGGYASNIRIIYDYIEGIMYNLTGLAVWIRNSVDGFERADRDSDAIISELNTQINSNRYLEHREKTKEKVAASIANVWIKFTEGAARAVEGVIDGAAITTVKNDAGIHEHMQLVDSDGNVIENPIVKYRENVMSFVAEEHVENAYEDFYNNTDAGKYLDEKAYEPFKSDGIGCEIAEGVGYTTTIAAIGGATGGGTSVAAGLMAVTAFISAEGKYNEEILASLRDASWEGMEEMYEDGEITEEVFNSYMMIRCLSDEKWNEIENDYKNGIITSEEYEQMKYLREMPEKWTTKENLQKGIAYGTASGLWEGIQWYVGANLAKWISSAAGRVAIDTAFNAADTPVRAGIDSLVTGQAYDEAWIEQGGWTSVLRDAGIGLVGSAGGEALDAIKKTNVGSSVAEKINNNSISYQKGSISGKIKVNIEKLLEAINDNKERIDRTFDKLELDDEAKIKIISEMVDDFENGKIDSEICNYPMEVYLEVQERAIDFRVELQAKELLEKHAKLFEKYDEERANKIAKELMYQQRAGKLDLSKLTTSDLNAHINFRNEVITSRENYTKFVEKINLENGISKTDLALAYARSEVLTRKELLKKYRRYFP